MTNTKSFFIITLKPRNPNPIYTVNHAWEVPGWVAQASLLRPGPPTQSLAA
jgi:hypothetical protein